MGIIGHGTELRDVDVPEHAQGIYDGDGRALAALVLVDDDVAGQQETDLWLGAECFERELGIAGAQDGVLAEIHVQLLAQRRAHVDLRDHTEALLLEGRLGALARRFIGLVEMDGESVLGQCFVHRIPRSRGASRGPASGSSIAIRESSGRLAGCPAHGVIATVRAARADLPIQLELV